MFGRYVRPLVPALSSVQPARLETRTKESTHVCEYAMVDIVCARKVTVGTRTPTANGDLLRGV